MRRTAVLPVDKSLPNIDAEVAVPPTEKFDPSGPRSMALAGGDIAQLLADLRLLLV